MKTIASKNLGIFIPGIGDFLKSGDFYPGDRGFFEILGFLSPGIGDCFKSGDFYPGNWGFVKIWWFLSRGSGFFGDFLSPGFFGDRDFFRGMGYPTKKPPLIAGNVEFSYEMRITVSKLSDSIFYFLDFHQSDQNSAVAGELWGLLGSIF